jgi:glycosyltransferase involved in cell wall biosynthesis
MVRGGQIHVRNVVEGLRDRGHDVHLIDWNSEPDRQFQHSIEPRSRFVDGAVRTFQQVVQVSREIDIDVVVSKTRKVYFPGLAAARMLGIPHVAHVGSSPARPTSGIVDRLDAASFASRLRAPHDAYFVACKALGDDLRSKGVGRDRIYDVRNAVDTDRFVSDPDAKLSASARKQITNAKQPLLGFVGGITEYKGVFDLADAVKHTETAPTVVVAGDGPARAQFEQALGEHGLFLGSVDYEQMPAVYAAIDALILPSHTEGLPRVLLEAGATGKPSIATSVGGVPELIQDGETGLLCPPHKPSALAACIDELFTECDPATMGRRARELVTDEYTWEAQYDRYDSFLREIVACRQREQ